MKFRSNLQQTTINKILKTLQNRKLIKAVKSIAVRCARRACSLLRLLCAHKELIERSHTGSEQEGVHALRSGAVGQGQG
jgi:hypothetical protein